MPYRPDNRSLTAHDESTLGCPSCESERIETEWVAHHFPYGDGDAAVELAAKVPLRRCTACGEEFLDDESEDLIHEAVCRHLGVMTPCEVRAIRRQSGNLSQAEFARITRLGEATIGRWERGELIQNVAYDHFLYLLTYPENRIRLQQRVCRPGSEATDTSARDAAVRFRCVGVTDELKERAAAFKLIKAGAA